MAQGTQSKRMDIFDGYKGISIIMIMFYYFYQYLLPGGYLAVNVFILIAGFFNVRYFYLKSLNNEKVSIFSFYKRRFKRLFFPMLAVIITTIPFIILFVRDYFFNIRNMALSSLLFVNNYYQIIKEQSYFVQAANPSSFTHLWYVALLAQLLLLTPIFMKLFYSWHKKPSVAANFFLIVSVISTVLLNYWYKDGQDPTHVYYSLLTRSFAYTLGGALAMILPPKLKAKRMPRKVKRIFNITSFVCLILLFLMAKFMYGTMPFAYNYGMVLFTIVFVILLMTSIHPETIMCKLFSLKPLVYIGKRSYSIYLWYYPIYLLIPNILGPLAQNGYILLSVQFILLFVLSEINYQLFELEKISIPVGQNFNFKQMRQRFKFLKYHPQQFTFEKILTGTYLVLFSITVIGMAVAPESKNDTADELQKVIESNKKIAEKSQDEKSEEVKIINNIEGLSKQELLYANGIDISFFGDSILLSSADRLKEIFPKAIINGEVGRQLYNSVQQLQWLKSKGYIKPVLVTLLGSNGSFTEGQLKDYIDAAGKESTIFFVTAAVDRPWTNEVNEQLYQAEQKYGNVKIIDWHSYSSGHPEWFYEDNAHPNPEGAQEFSKFIAREVFRQR